MNPDWKSFSKNVVYTAKLHTALKHLDISIPKEGRPIRYAADGFTVQACIEGNVVNFVLWQGSCGVGKSQLCVTGGEVLKNLKPIPSYGETGASLREWLIMWGWQPPAKKAAAESTSPMVI